MRNQIQFVGDNVSIALATMCLIHCLALPVLIVFLPFVSANFLEGEAFHQLLLGGVLLTSVLALASGCKTHSKWHIFSFGITGLVVLSIAAFFGHDLLGENGETLLTIVGSVIVAFSHFKNIKACKQARCCSSAS
ncbi:MerC domain-containing protein [Pseudoalteromonas sp. SMS1]|uniref:MerC domain-containing protein n=1 Tax=Pseudoalteromonas sp. SMS1 TaxID=2908894 RepID=UPI001F432A37|nr:MerC domain-containing protein [Pseudoalteromonas sp. SMS1]MCF2857082.1 MerC domain-containing protein [Pseudoalteromonas sp. SMS1]